MPSGFDDVEGNRAAIAVARSPGSRALSWLQSAVSMALLVVTLWFLWQHARDAWRQVQEQERKLVFDPAWVVASGVLYALGMCLLGTPWYLVLRDRQRANLSACQFSYADVSRVFLISQVGKYVPGKAMVLVIRYALLGRRGLTIGMTALTSIYETFSTMATGALVASVLLIAGATPTLWSTLSNQHSLLPAASTVFALAFVASVLPPVFSLLPRMTSKVVTAARRHVEQPIEWRTFRHCLAWGVAAWLVLGASFWACVQAVALTPLSIATIPAMTAIFALSFVAGFLSMIPGQFGVREVILLEGIEPLVDGDNVTALSATLLSRMITLVVEILIALILYLTLREGRAKVTAEQGDPDHPADPAPAA